VTRRVWAVRGQRPIAVQRRGFKWCHVYGFVQPKTGSNELWVVSHVDVECMQAVLDEFKACVDPLNQKIIVLLLDNAGWHRSNRLVVAEGIVLKWIPAYTPELSPAEGLMPLLHECVANKCLERIEDVEAVLVERCAFLMGHPSVVKARCGFAWASL
jgi:hypothetical protein